MTIKDTMMDFDNNKINIETDTPKLLRKYSWQYRMKQENTLLPDKVYMEIQEQIENSFTGDFQWIGKHPYLLYANLIGMRKHLLASDDDSVIGIVAPPGTGKSTTALASARLLDPTFTIEMVIFNIAQLRKFIKKATMILNQIKESNNKGEHYPNPLAGCVVLLDEGVYILFSGDAQSRNGKLVQKLFSIIRALNLIFLVNITNWKKISSGVKEDRFACLIRLPRKGVVEFRSKKKVGQIKLEYGSLKWPSPNFYDRTGYISHNCNFWKEYEVKKSQFLVEAAHEVGQ